MAQEIARQKLISSDDRAESKQGKKVILAVLVSSFCIYKLLFTSTESPCLIDFTHTVTQPINDLIRSSKQFAQAFILMGQLLVDTQFVAICVLSVTHYKRLNLHLWYSLFYGIRAIFISIEYFPFPTDTYWVAPNYLPSLAVAYGVTRDFFYSGHTGFLFYTTLVWHRHGWIKLKYLSGFSLCFVVVLILSCRVHFVIDVVAAGIYGVVLDGFTLKYTIWYDKFWTGVYNAGKFIWEAFRGIFA